jgi:hypothetical protein
MKSKTKRVLAPVLAISLVFALPACVNQDVKTLGTGTDLQALRIGDTAVKLADDPATEMKEGKPDPINASEWERDDFNLNGADFGWIAFKQSKDLVVQRVRATVSRGALAEWGVGTRSSRPGYFSDTRVPMSFESDEYIYIRVTSEDKANVSYYRFYAKLLSTVNELSSISTGKRIAKAEAVPGSTYDQAQEDVFHITTGEATNAVIVAATFDPNATVQFARATGTDDPTNSFRPSSQPVTLADQDLLYVKVTAENTVDSVFYKFRVNVGRMATIERLFFEDTAEEEIFGKGLPKADWAAVGPGSYDTAKPPAAGYAVRIVTDDPDATFQYARIDNPKAGLPAFGANPAKVAFTEGGQTLAIKVTAKNKDNDGGDIFMYYKIKVNLLAAKIKTHPKSAWYMQGTAAKPLTVVLEDEYLSGSYTYQWYEADSLYGLYGRHGMDLDEKNNVSTVNGGPSMYFYLVEPDSTDTNSGQIWAWTIPGATSASYTPPTNWVDVDIVTQPDNDKQPIPPTPPNVNFITGSTSEVRYYWVKITNTANNRSVTSERALILTETDPEMDHYIFDLSVLPNKNIVPFTAKNNDPYYGGEPYKIDLKELLKDFPVDPSKYEICVAQAQYFLPDGRAWTQNWTHGDLHFGYDPDSKNDPLTWWHNNLGANSGAIPLQAPHSSQGGLSNPPDWVGFKPSGDPDKGIPANYTPSSTGIPTEDSTGGLPKGTYGTSGVSSAPAPYPRGDAQGYFCGFIKLMELRFATAPSN